VQDFSLQSFNSSFELIDILLILFLDSFDFQKMFAFNFIHIKLHLGCLLLQLVYFTSEVGFKLELRVLKFLSIF